MDTQRRRKRSSAAAPAECAAEENSCVITAKITLTGDKPSLGAVIKQACAAKDLEDLTTKFEHPVKIENDAEVSFYCKTDNCNVDQAIKGVLKENVADTIAAMKGTVKAGAAQTSVAVATIAFSMAMARLAL